MFSICWKRIRILRIIQVMRMLPIRIRRMETRVKKYLALPGVWTALLKMQMIKQKTKIPKITIQKVVM